MNGADKGFVFLTVSRHTATSCAEMTVVVGAVKQVGHATFVTYSAEETSHNIL